MEISVAGEGDLDELLPLMRAYCDFYDVAPSDEDLLALSRALIADPEREGVQLIARGDDGAAVGFATVFWSWTTTRGRAAGGDERPVRGAPRHEAAGRRRRPDRGLRRARPRARRGVTGVVDRAGQPPRPEGLRPRRRRGLRWLSYSLETSGLRP